MRKMFTKLFGLALLMFLFGTLTEVRAQVVPTDCGQTITDANVELVTPLIGVCDSSNVTFKVVGDFADTVLFAFNYDGNTTGGFTSNPNVTIKEGLDVWIQVMEVTGGDTCISEPLPFSSNVVDSIKILAPEMEHPMCGSDFGEVTINFSGGYVAKYLAASGVEYPYLYTFVPIGAWVGETGDYTAYTDVAPNLSTGADTFFVSVRENDVDTCLIDQTLTIAWDTAVVNETTPAVVLDTIYSVDPVCFGEGGMVGVVASAGTPASYGYMVDLYEESAPTVVVMSDTTVNDTAKFYDVPAGTYFAMVTDSLLCEATSDSMVTIVAADEVDFDIAIKSVDCFGGNNGEITAFILSDTANTYEALVVSLDTAVDNTVYTWQSMGANDSVTITGLYPIYYALFVKDVTNGCDSVPYVNPNNSQNYISLQTPGEVTFDLTYEFGMDSIPCYGDSIWVTVDNFAGGSGNYETTLSNGGLITGWSDTTSWLLPVGTYFVEVRDADLGNAGCGTDSVFTIAGNDELNVWAETTNPICPGGPDGLIEIYAEGGTGTYEYSIDSVNWYTNNVFNGVADEYKVYARDAVCPENMADNTAEIKEVDNLISVVDSDTMICEGSTDGYIVVGVDSWNITSGMGIEHQRMVRAYYTTDMESVGVSGTQMERTVDASNGYHISFEVQDLMASTYYIWAVDTFGCVGYDSDDDDVDYLTVVIHENDPLMLDVEVVDSASCANVNDGLIKLTMSGGDTTSWYLMSSLVAEKSASKVIAPKSMWDCGYGSFKYAVAATYQQALLKTPGSMNCWPVVAGIPSYEDESVIAEKSAIAAPGDYYAEEVYINITAGTHYIVLYDEACDQRVIEEVNVFGYGAVEAGAVDSVTNIVCYGDDAGEIVIESAMGGSGDLVYTLYEGGMTMADTVEGYVEVMDTAFVGLPAGNYHIEVTDLGPSACEGDWIHNIAVTQPDLDFSIEVFDITCNGEADGLVVLSMDGAEDGAPMFKLGSSNWRPFDTYSGGIWTKNVNVVEEGDYTVWAIDTAGYLAGCDGMAIDFTVVEPPVLTVDAVGVDSTDCSIADDGFITVMIEGGKAIVDSFEVQLTGIDTALIHRDSVLVFSGLATGTYELVVTEVDSLVNSPCIIMDSIDVMDNGIVASIEEFTEMLACKDDSTGIIELDITGGSGVYMITLNMDTVELDANNQITGLPAGEYAIVVQDSVKTPGNDTVCVVALDTVVIGEPDEYLMLDATKIQDVTCQDSGMFSIQASGGTPGYEYFAALSVFPEHMLLPDPESAEWQSDSIFTVADYGTWVVWVKDAAGCIVGGEFDKNDDEINKWRIPILPPNVIVEFEATIADAIDCSGDEATVVVLPDSVHILVDSVEMARGYTVWFENMAGDILVENDTIMAMDTVVAWVQDTLSGCKGYDIIPLSQPEPLMAVSLTKGDGEFTCPDVVEGYIEAYAMGGTEPYSYQLWQNGAVKTPSYKVDEAFLVDVDNSYSFVVKDANGCTDTLDIPVMIESAEPIEFEIIRETTCAADTAASVEITVSGEPGRMFQVQWSQVENTGGSVAYSDTSAWYPAGIIELDQVFKFDNENLADKHYEVTVVDNMGCTSDSVYSVTYDDKTDVPVELTITVGVVNDCTTDVTISAAGNAGSYTFMVDDVVVEAGLQMLSGGEHVIYVEDINGCWDSDTITLAYPMSMDTTLNTYVGEAVQFEYADAMLDTMLYAGDYTFLYAVDSTCTNELNVTVIESPRTAPVLDTMSPMDTIADNHPTFEIVFEGPVTFNDSVMGYLTVTPEDTTEAVLMIEITSAMVSGNTITVDYVLGDGELGLDKNTTYVVAVDSGVVWGDGLTWDGVTPDWMFTTGPDFATGIDNGLVDGIEFKVYPNPFNDHIKIDNFDKLTRVVITNIAGQRVLDIEYPSYEIRTGNLVTGVYVVTLITDDKIVKSERIIKR